MKTGSWNRAFGLFATVILAVSQASALSANAWAGGDSRSLMAERLKAAQLGMAPGAAELLSQICPSSIVTEVLKFRRPTLVHFAVRCIPLERASADTLMPTGELFCACSGAWANTYLAVIRESARQWSKSWDTVFREPSPNLLLDTMSLGIETSGYRSLMISGIASVKGDRGFVLITWDGTVGRVVSPVGLVGQQIEVTDLDGDGIKEVSVALRPDTGDSTVKKVFSFDRASKSYKYVTDLKTGRYEKKDQR